MTLTEIADYLEKDSPGQYTELVNSLRATAVSNAEAVQKGHLETASGKHLPIPTPKRSGRPQFGPQNYQDFALTPFIAQNPLSWGGATFAPVNDKLLYPWREEDDIEKRSPMWNLMGYA